jgi:hypothetical protein
MVLHQEDREPNFRLLSTERSDALPLPENENDSLMSDKNSYRSRRYRIALAMRTVTTYM